jgi:hypothetical protein
MNFSQYVIVGRAFAMLGSNRRLSFEFRDPYTLKSLYRSLVCSKLKYVSFVWSPFYDVRAKVCRDGLYETCVVWVG